MLQHNTTCVAHFFAIFNKFYDMFNVVFTSYVREDRGSRYKCGEQGFVRFSPATATTNVLQTNADHDQESQTEAKKTSILALGRNDDIYAVAGRVSAAAGESL